jgi:molybdopterin molybdotransferase
MSLELITVSEARQRVLLAVAPLGHGRVRIGDALGRVLATDVVAETDLPPFPSSAMDGYAIRGATRDRTLAVVGESRAGEPFAGTLADGEAVRVSTGAAVPDAATAVIKQEDVLAGDGAITLGADVEPGENIRRAGEVTRSGTPVLAAGTTITPAELGVAVAAGAGELTVARRPRVAVLCTGDELREPAEPLGPGEIYNSNGPMLAAFATRCGAIAPASGRLPDDPGATERGLRVALTASDVVIVSGGVSVGPHDHVKPALARLGVREAFWGVALQPGKPTWFGTLDRKLVFGLPGNPVSAAVTFALFVTYAIAALQGGHVSPPPAPEAVIDVAVRRNRAREQALRVRLHRRDGTLFATPNGAQGSHAVTSLAGADALALIPSGDGELGPGSSVALEHFPR